MGGEKRAGGERRKGGERREEGKRSLPSVCRAVSKISMRHRSMKDIKSRHRNREDVEFNIERVHKGFHNNHMIIRLTRYLH